MDFSNHRKTALDDTLYELLQKVRYVSRVVGVKCKSTAAYIVVREDTFDTQTTH